MSALKIPLQRTIPESIQARILSEIAVRGSALPCHVTQAFGPYVKVAFDIDVPGFPPATLPVWGSQWQRVPYQPGNTGVTFPVDAAVLRQAGFSTTVPSLAQAANLSSLVWLPVSSKNFSAAEDLNAHILYGPDGVILRDTNSAVTAKFNPNTGVDFEFGGGQFLMNTSGIQLNFGGHSVTINSSGVYIDGYLFVNHTHLVIALGAQTDPVTPGT